MAKKQRKSSTKNGNRVTAQSLKQICNSLAYLVVNSGNLKGKKQQDLISILSDLGFGKKVIATVLHAPPETVSERLSERKAAKKKAKKNANGSSEEANQPKGVEQSAQ